MRAGSSCIVTLLVALATNALAQPSPQGAAATAEFDKGRNFMKEKKFAEACAAFERSQKLDAQWGTLYNLAGCYVEVGKLASAWAAYRELAQRDTNAGRKKASDKLAAALAKRIPKLAIKVASAPAGLVVTLDGADVTALVGTDVPVDLGAHAIRATAPTFKDFETSLKITDEGKTTALAIDLTTAREPPKPEPPKPEPPKPEPPKPVPPVVTAEVKPAVSEPPAETVQRDEPPRSRRKLIGIVVASTGAAFAIAGLVVGNAAKSKWNEAKQVCGDDLGCSNPADLARGNQLVDDANKKANLSTALMIGAGVAVAAGVVLIVTAPRPTSSSTALRIVPTLAPGTAAITIGRAF